MAAKPRRSKVYTEGIVHAPKPYALTHLVAKQADDHRIIGAFEKQVYSVAHYSNFKQGDDKQHHRGEYGHQPLPQHCNYYLFHQWSSQLTNRESVMLCLHAHSYSSLSNWVCLSSSSLTLSLKWRSDGARCCRRGSVPLNVDSDLTLPKVQSL